jgi:repressor LexA
MKVSKSALTEKQENVFHFILRYYKSKGYPPTVKEIQEEFSYRSPTTVSEYLRALTRKGYVRIHPKISRGIKILKGLDASTQYASVPKIALLGDVPAGTPTEAIENPAETIAIDPETFGIANFALKVKGDSMIGAGICDGDIVLVKQQPQAEHQEIIVALVDKEATVKRFYSRGRVKKLVPENPKYPEIPLNGDRSFMTLGKVVGLMRKIY